MIQAKGRFKLIKAGRLIDGLANRPLEKGAVLIEGSDIRQVGAVGEVRAPEGAAVDEFSYPEGTILPGLVDVHVHFNYMGDGTHTDDVMKLPDELLLVRSLANARTHLQSGVTTIRECGSKHATTFSLREGVRQALAVGPRMLLCGNPVTITGGHMWQMGAVADGVDGVRATVRRLIGDGADWIKVPATGGTTSTSFPLRPSFTVEELKAIAEEAHKFGKLAGAHCGSTQGTINSLDAGIDMIIHSHFREADGTPKFREDVAERIGRQEAFVNPTLYVNVVILRRLEEKEEREGLTSEERAALDQMRRYWDARLDHIGRMASMGVKFAAGSDAGFGYYPLGQFAREFEALTQAGFSPMQAIMAGTREAANSIGLGRAVGTLEPGKVADVLIVNGDPSKDINDLSKVKAVFQCGHLVHST